jgi:hypothetical protein
MEQKLKRQFDALCALKGLNMSEIVENLVSIWVLQNSPPGFIELNFEDFSPKAASADASIAQTISGWDLNELSKLTRIKMARLRQIGAGEPPTNEELIQLGRYLRRPDGSLYETEGLLKIRERDFPDYVEDESMKNGA